MTTRRALPNRRSVLASIAAVGAFAATGARAQSNWPDHPVRIIVPYPAGGSTDVLSRILAERMSPILKPVRNFSLTCGSPATARMVGNISW